MHETARHAIHSCEILSVSVETVEAMQQQVIDLSGTHKGGSSSCAEASNQIRLHLDIQIRMFCSLFLLSQLNKERLQNEIALVRCIRWQLEGPMLIILQAYNLIA
jgi:hypothetical protein